MAIDASSPPPAEFRPPDSLEERADMLEQLASDVRAGADPVEAIARLALIMAADQRDGIYG